MDAAHFLQMVGTLVLASCLGAMIGFERERHDRPAGLRTHILVCTGASLITLVSRDLAGERYDPGRIAAQIVSGIGFLGAGTILRQGSAVRGLTTAASLWVAAGIGMATAARAEIVALGVIATLIVVFTLSVVSRLEEQYVQRRRYHGLMITIHGSQEDVGLLLTELSRRQVETRRVRVTPAAESGHLSVHLSIRSPAGFSTPQLTSWLSQLRGVVGLEWE
jgi:putative Mg2+ transporter-C (MgtC) family protein